MFAKFEFRFFTEGVERTEHFKIAYRAWEESELEKNFTQGGKGQKFNILNFR